ncbi:class I SAM-dependent methyltransferase [Polyangium jinanense]|uniref:Class I SAM-dependent methyltransferase n=1 Tax=Polyangium jinanense TaxID=2829994 RepID=A0A9X3X6T7_9BACT|nr:class I SAM-dependent methyltransferase [Polyangium jinanense]MDC3959950.1 class I SAM-dependent methyltransferase [Polyangium jinanense]MDC3983830.1 class I SAM-dependent methyltransferase [Polyangium jinanense]
MKTDEHGKHAVIFGRERALKYDSQVRLSMEGYDAMHQVAAEVLVAALSGQKAASLLMVGIGTGSEVKPFARHAGADFHFTGVDPSPEMIAIAREKLAAAGLLERTSLHACELRDLPRGPSFDGAQMIGVLHHLPDDEARIELLREIAGRLVPGAHFVIGCRVGNEPLLRAVEEQRLVANGWPPEAAEHRRKAMASMRIPASDAEVFALLAQAGFAAPRFIFGELQFRVWVARYEPSSSGA